MVRTYQIAGLLMMLALSSCSSDGGSDDVATGDTVVTEIEVKSADVGPETDTLLLDVVPEIADLAEVTDVAGQPEAEVTEDVAPDGLLPIEGHWEQLATPLLGEHVLKGVWGFDDGNVIAVGEAGLVTAKVKNTFVPSYQDPSLNILNGVWGASTEDIWTVGMYGLIYHYDGAGWTMPKYCVSVDDCTFSGDCLLAECTANECIYTPTGKAGCCGSVHFESGFDEGGQQFQFEMEDLYKGTPDGGLTWQVVSVIAADGAPRFVSAPNALYFGDPTKPCSFDPQALCPNYSNGKAVGATASSPPVTIPGTAEQVKLSFQLYIDLEASPYADVFKVQVLSGGKWEDVWNKSSLSGNFLKSFMPIQVDMSKYVGKTVRYRFHFDSVTPENNAFEGIYIDNIKLSSTCSVAGSLAGKFPTLWSVWGASPDEVFAVGSNGWAVYYDGTSWQKQAGDETYLLKSVHGPSTDDMVLVGKEGLLMHSKGAGWEKEFSGTSKDITKVWGTSPGKYVAVGPTGTVLTFNGVKWTANAVGSANYNDLIGFSDTEYYLVGSGGSVVKHDGGGFLQQPSALLGNLYGVFGEDGQHLTVVGDKLIASGSADMLVQEEGLPIVTNWKAVWGKAGQRYVVGEYGKAMHWDGVKWNKLVSGVETALLDIWGFDHDDIYAVGEEGVIIHYDGEAWSPMEAIAPEGVKFVDVWGPSKDEVYVVAEMEGFGYLLAWDGTNWKVGLSATTVDLRHVHGSAGDNVFAVGQGGTIIRYDGNGWGLMPIDPYETDDGPMYITQNLFGVFAMSENDVWAGGDEGVLVHYDGATFSLAGMLGSKIRALWGVREDAIWAVGNSGVVFRFDGQSWTQEETGTVATIHAIWGDTVGNIYAVGDNGVVLAFVEDDPVQ